MFRQWKTTLREAGSPTSRRRKHRFVPSLSGSLSQLEDRVVLSGASHAAAVAHRAAVLEGTHAGQVVTNLYDSILGTKPGDTQLINGVRDVRQGHTKALRNQLLKLARTENPAAADTTAVTVSVRAAGSSTPITAFSTTFNTPGGAPLTPTQVNQVTTLLAQNLRNQSAALTSTVNGGSSLSLSVSTTRTIGPTGTTISTTSTISTPTGTATTTGTSTIGTPTTTTTATTTPTTTTTATTTPLTTTTLTFASSTQELEQALLLALQAAATPVTALPTTTTTSQTVAATPLSTSQLSTSQTSLSQLPISQVSFTGLTTTNSPINPSPVGNTLPTVNSPINASPVGNLLPTINSPINASPIGNTLPTVNSPINASPIGSIII